MKNEVFPEQGQAEDEVFDALDQVCADDLQANGRAFAFTYDAGADVKRVARQAFSKCMTINGLDPTVYPSARRLENDVVSAALEHLRAPAGAVGTATTCGTESVMLSIKTARDHARKTRPEITEPELLLPVTAHASFHKGAHLFGVKPVVVDVHPESFQALVDDAKRKLSKNTILVVGSAPGYAHGVVDPITELAALAKDNGALCHVDGCVGGWVLPFQRQLGIDVPDMDFSVPGVTSISVDLHKYAFAPKGVSLLLQRNNELREAQFFTCATWTGYAIINTTLMGSKSLASLGAAWTLLRKVGKSGYRDMVDRMWKATQKLVEATSEMDDVYILGRPSMGLVGLACRRGDAFVLSDRLTEKGWHVQPTYASGPSPAHVHLIIDPGNAAHIDEFIRDLKACEKGLPEMTAPPEQVVQLLTQAVTSPDADTAALMDQFGVQDGQLPGASADLHRVLNGLSQQAREALLVKFMGALFS